MTRDQTKLRIKENADISPATRIERSIHLVRGQKVMLDFDLAALYGVKTKALNQAVKRNKERFPDDFMFVLSVADSKSVMAASGDGNPNWSQSVTSSLRHRGSTYRFYAFTEQGIAMLSSVLRSPRAVQVNIEIMRAFVRLRGMLSAGSALSRRLDDLEEQYDGKFKMVFEAIRALMRENGANRSRREIGFHTALRPEKRKQPRG